MTVVSDIIAAGYRESNTLALGQAIPTAATTEALALLQTLVLSAVGAELGYTMEDWNIANAAYTRPNGVAIPAADMAAFTVKPNSRLLCKLTAGLTVTLDPLPQDGQRFSAVDAKANFGTYNLTVNPNGRKIEASTANLVLSTNSTAKQWIYRSDLGDWVILDTLTTGSEMPFPADFDDYFKILLAMRINPRYGKTLDAQSKARMDQQELQFVNRYTQSRLRSVPSPAASNPARTPEGN